MGSESSVDSDSNSEGSSENASSDTLLVLNQVPSPDRVLSPATVMSSSSTVVTAVPAVMNPQIVDLLSRISLWASWSQLVQVEDVGYRLEFAMNLSHEEGDMILGASQSDRYEDSDSESEGDPGSDRGDVVDYEGNLE